MTALSAPARSNHARYLVKNGIAGGDIVLEKGQLRFHDSAGRLPLGGQRTARLHRQWRVGRQERVVLSTPEIDLSGADFVDLLMTMPFSGLIPMVPQFSVVGLGAYCDSGLCAIVIRIVSRWRNPCASRSTTDPRATESGIPSLGLIPIETGRLRIARRISARWLHRRPAVVSTAATIPILLRVSRLQHSDRHSDFDSTGRRLRP